MLSTRTWSALSVLRETVRCRVWIRVLRLRGRSLLLMVLLMYNARGSRLLKMMRRWRTLLRVVGMMFFDLAWWTDEGTKKLKRLRKRSGSKQCRRIETKEGKIEIDRSEDKKNDEGGSG
jgi:hypothetical protein